MAAGFTPLGRYLSRKADASRRQRARRCHLAVEPLETRVVLTATNLGVIDGTVGLDIDMNGVIDDGEGVSNVEVRLYEDTNDNNVFDPSTDTRVDMTTTGTDGSYAFEGLETGNYFVVQPSQPVGSIDLAEQVSSRQAISGAGVTGETIDPFTTDSGPTADQHPPDTPVEEVFSAPEAIGGQRDFTVELTAGNSGDTVQIRTTNDRLLVNPDLFAVGTYMVTWDGVDNAGDGLDPEGLQNFDLTEIGGITGLGSGICLTDVMFDQAGAIIRVRIYTSATEFSEAVISGIDPMVTHNYFIPFSGSNDGLEFTTAGTVGPADFTDVGAIELEVQATQPAMDGSLMQFGVLGIDPQTVNFVNDAPAAVIDVEKFTNGNQADDPTDADVPIVNLNTTTSVTWTYEVTNTGEAALNSVQLQDDQLGTIPGANITDRSLNSDDILDVGEVWTYTVAGAATVGAYSNEATVTAVSDLDIPATDSDTSNYFGISPAIDIEKYTNGNQADSSGGADVPQLTVGSAVTWTYEVTNTGTDPLVNVQVTDNVLGGISVIIDRSINNDNILDVGEVWTYSASGVARAGAYENRGTVVGTASDDSTVNDTDLSHYRGLTPGMDIEKLTNGEDADTEGSGPEVSVGSNVTFTYRVTNTGEVPLANVRVSDDNGTPSDATDDFFATFVSGDTNNDDLLDLNELWSFTAQRTATLGSYTNVGTVTANDDAGTGVSATDPSNHTGTEISRVMSKRRFLASSFA